VLRFSLGDIPVKVHFSFLVIAILSPSSRAIDIVAWVLVVFLAVLLHEVGHALTARHYGAMPVSITLFALGGVTVYPAIEELTPGRRFVISAMGSVVGIVTGGIIGLLWLAGLFDTATRVVRVAALSYIWAGLGWGVLNWIPIRPLDGGAMLTSALEIVMPQRAVPVAKAVSAVFGVGAAALLWYWGQTFGAFFVLLITAMGLSSGGAERQAAGSEEGPAAASQREMTDADVHRIAATQAFMEDYGLPAGVASKAALALHPLDDVPVPSPVFGERMRDASSQFAAALGQSDGRSDTIDELATRTLTAYKSLAAATGDVYYERRFETALRGEGPVPEPPPRPDPPFPI
jgi:Zn-dependent protease